MEDDKFGRRDFIKSAAAAGIGLNTLNTSRTGLEELPDGTVYDPQREVGYKAGEDIVNKEPGKPPETEAFYE